MQIARPRPVPPYLRLINGCSCEKDWNSRFSLLSAMPTPVSRTENSSRYSGEPGSGIFFTDRVTLPRSVNFSALPTRLTIICRKRLGSVVTASGTLVSAHQRSASFFSSALGVKRSMTLSIISRSTKVSDCSGIFPASILLKSRISFRICSRL
ncbi:hypothetical protein D3C73_1098370 [compost metagenome]